MKLHVLSGDSLVKPFEELSLGDDFAVFRECLVDGPVSEASIDDLFRMRSEYLSRSYPNEDGFYEEAVRPEIERILMVADGTEVFLWFEHELFCQVNLWFLLSRFVDRDVKLAAVLPKVSDAARRFDGWAHSDSAGLMDSFRARVPISGHDRVLGAKLWKAFSADDGDALRVLASESSYIFRFIGEVITAATEMPARPFGVIRKILGSGAETFGEVFREFSKLEPVYGFGDLQVKKIYDEVAEG